MYLVWVGFMLLATLPFVIAILYRFTFVSQKQEALLQTLRASSVGATEFLSKRGGENFVRQEVASAYNARLVLPPLILSALYALGFRLVLCAMSDGDAGALCPFADKWLKSAYPLLMAFLGVYAFNTGALFRRLFRGDLTEHVFWGAINRFVIVLGIAAVTAQVWHGSGALLFLVAFTPSLFMDWLKAQASTIFSVNRQKIPELPLQMVVGIDVWKEYRLEEEGIESVENLATADVLSLAVRTHYNLRTLVDWIDQAILIQRLGDKVSILWDRGLGVSAVDFAWRAPSNSGGNLSAARIVAGILKLDPEVVADMMDSFYQDQYVQMLWTIWQSGADTALPAASPMTRAVADDPGGGH